MRFFRTDFRLKYIIAEVEGTELTVSFRYGWIRGIYDISIRADGEDRAILIKNVYPGLFRRIREALLLVMLDLEHAINHISNRSS